MQSKIFPKDCGIFQSANSRGFHYASKENKSYPYTPPPMFWVAYQNIAKPSESCVGH